MARMEMRTREAPMEWEREQDRNLPNIFSNPQLPAYQTTTPAISNGQQQKPFGFGASVQRGSSFSSNQGSFTSDGGGATAPKHFHQDSQPSAGAATFSRQDSFSFGSGRGSFSRSQSPNNTAPQGFTGAGATTLHRDGSATSEVMDVDECPSTRSAKTGGSELFDMGSLRSGVGAEQQGLSPRRLPGKSRSSSSSAMVGSRTSSMQYRGSGSAGRGSKFWSDDDDEVNEEDLNDPEDDSEEDNYDHRGSGRQPNRHMTRNMDGRRRGRDQDSSERRRADHVQSPAPQGRVWSENVDLPYILSGYVQVAMNSAFVGIVFYIIYNFITTIQSDVSIRAENALVQEREKRDKCEQDYLTELCYKPHGPSHKPLCDHLFACKNNPLPRIERSTVAAQTFAIIFNAFVHTISYKTMGFLVVIVFGGLYFSNHAISSYRHNHLLHHQDPIAHPGYAPPPPTSGSITAGASNTNSMIPAGLKRNDSNNLSNNGGSLLGSTSLSLSRGGGSHMSTSSSKSLTLQHRGSRHTFPDSDNE
ncbi:MAG: Di-sulfide bridge nucleocytoplasmic transport domain-containing protein [Linnemannia elongata]|nr:MAG: Di-sulfide bridge nucleocytoplasmic transport domain-containing protein [Linnemannia elongata]